MIEARAASQVMIPPWFRSELLCDEIKNVGGKSFKAERLKKGWRHFGLLCSESRGTAVGFRDSWSESCVDVSTTPKPEYVSQDR